MTLSVLTIVKNRSAHLTQLVKGLCRSDVPPLELVVVDMGSTPSVSIDSTPFPNHVLRLDRPGLPLAEARNAAAQAARSDTWLFLDVDCIPMRGLIGAMAHALTEHDALICAEALYLGANDARAAWKEDDLLKRGSKHPVRQFPESGVRAEADAGLFWSLVFGIRRHSFEKVGGFDQAFTGYGAEDTDFGFRARQAKLPLLFMGGPGAFHQYHDSYEPPFQHLDDIVRNAVLFRKKWRIWPMEGWLAAFEKAGLIQRHDEAITILRRPDSSSIEQARVVPTQ